jgi:hypothetical protein
MPLYQMVVDHLLNDHIFESVDAQRMQASIEKPLGTHFSGWFLNFFVETKIVYLAIPGASTITWRLYLLRLICINPSNQNSKPPFMYRVKKSLDADV